MNTSNSLSIKRIFLAGPSDVEAECSIARRGVDSLSPTAGNAGVRFEIVSWHEAVPNAGRAEQVILDHLKLEECDVFFGILWHRFGSPTGAVDRSTGKPYLSGFEEEFRKACRLRERCGRPLVMVYFKIADVPYNHDPDQFKQVKEFQKEVADQQGRYRVLYGRFDTVESFRDSLLKDLQELLIRYREVKVEPRNMRFVQPVMNEFQVTPGMDRARGQKPKNSSRKSRSTNQR